MPTINPEIIEYAERNDCGGILRCLAKGNPIDEQRKDGCSALLAACKAGSFDAVKVLVEHNASLILKDKNGEGAMYYAAAKNRFEIVAYLLSKNVNANECDSQGRNALHIACQCGANETVLYLLNNKAITDINAKTLNKKDALLLSIEGNCSVNTVLELLVNGACVTTTTTENRNVLMECARCNNTKLFHVLYRYSNININCKDTYDNCCIHFASEAGNLHMLKALLHRGAFVRVHNKKGKFPIELAEEKGHQDCVKLLKVVSTAPAEPIIENVFLSSAEENAVAVVWSKPRKFNFYPTITAVEIQIKTQRLFDTWKTVGTIQMNDSPFKEKISKNKVCFDDGELTDVDDEADLDERNEVEMNCLSMIDKENLVEKRYEVNNQENALPRFYIIKGLVSNTKYTVRVRLANKYGWGLYSNGVNFCIKDGLPDFHEEDAKIPTILRSSVMIKNQITNRNDKSYETSITNGSTLTDLNRAFENQRKSQQSIHSVNANEVMTRMLSEGVSYLDVLLKNYSDLSTLRNSNGMSILHAAAASATLRGVELVKEIVKRNLISVNDHSKTNSIPLHYAIYNNNLEAAIFLIENQSDLSATDTNGRTPFLLAADRGNLQVCQLLVEKLTKTQLYTVDNIGRNALMLAVNSSHLHVAEYLIEVCKFDPLYKLPPPSCWNLLFFAINTKNDGVVKYCLEKGVSPVDETVDGLTAIDYSHEKGTEQITTILEHYSKVPDLIENASIQPGATQAIIKITLPVVKEKHSLFNLTRVEVSYKKNVMLSTSLTEAVMIENECREVSIVLNNLLPQTQYKCKIRCFNKNGPSGWKSGFDFETTAEEMNELKQEENEEIEKPADIQGVYSIIEKTVRIVELQKQMEVFQENEIIHCLDIMDEETLNQTPAEVIQTTRDSFNLPCLHHVLLTAASHTESEIYHAIDILLKKGCTLSETVNSLGLLNLSPVDCACLLPSTQYLSYLLDKGGNISYSQVFDLPSSFFYSLLAPTSLPCSFLLQTTSIDLFQLNKKQPLLHLLAKIHKFAGVEAIASLLLQNGIDINQLNTNGDSVLHTCVQYNNTFLLTYLIMNGAKIDILNNQHKTAYQIAEETGNGVMISIFMNAYRTPLPIMRMHLQYYTQSILLLSWESPTLMNGTPAIDSYEVELYNTNMNTTLTLPTVPTTYCMIEIPRCMHQWINARVRCHNQNGWSEWSNYCSSQVEVNDFMHDDFYTWLVCHECEDCYEDLHKNTLQSLQDLSIITVDQLSSNWFFEEAYRIGLCLPSFVKEKIAKVLPEVCKDNSLSVMEIVKKAHAYFSWFM